ncbi:tRNA (adenosine(37)-N6)-threonylcarbamoyltransferase complex transferase subunit TsaD [Candidatus Uabimicrobium sp. HlEnr_7]|uniref:tRNA (adenosine(37)-N6)-threonylcarbamoyltransferase complex transferase subunit TsaD n=1 Tax=Candidatus Uabimicrobium helgolandensis TaxID=3095367 RepID=UPI00355811E6
MHTTILAIDTSCDDTAVAVLKDDMVFANIVSSQADIHKEWGGVVPNLARRAHQEKIMPCIDLALQRAQLTMEEISAVAVTYGPGLAPSLEVGVDTAKTLALKHDKPLIGVNHMEGHILSPLLKNSKGNPYTPIPEIEYPILAMSISGGHTEIVQVKKKGQYEIVGQTLDDAVGEAFDKVARMLELGYPGGPIIEEIALKGDENSIPLPRPMSQNTGYDFSYSGLKTACLYKLRDLKKEKELSSFLADFCASFQEAAIDSLLIKLKKACKKIRPTMVLVAGGVSANNRLRQKFRKAMGKFNLPVVFPHKKFCMDNAAMIGLVAYHKYSCGEFIKDKEKLDRNPSLVIGQKNIYEN